MALLPLRLLPCLVQEVELSLWQGLVASAQGAEDEEHLDTQRMKTMTAPILLQERVEGPLGTAAGSFAGAGIAAVVVAAAVGVAVASRVPSFDWVPESALTASPC
eukprot:CAMPEP_0206583560 /NCGR_PEP_ID=MMETSP0325_2-20121206/35178_1 /ASSEMBLY_ACC=CAM_ASM_000347 /TAXON_ID=2866 /ORGANISM="Crypthecodinium cohnii, Strain Seligo" /LENGTH=104 /DNA_ID=CAMNT_0054090507 /DNA_START=528 /DNA_END=842 /DNA_ORIENTATION=+